MAFSTAIAFTLLGFACIANRPREGLARLFTEDTAGAVVARRVLPVATLTPMGIGMIRLFLTQHHVIENSASMATGTVVSMFIIGAIVLRTAGTLSTTDRMRQEAERMATEMAERYRSKASGGRADGHRDGRTVPRGGGPGRGGQPVEVPILGSNEP
jgi:hypothetical protein